MVRNDYWVNPLGSGHGGSLRADHGRLLRDDTETERVAAMCGGHGRAAGRAQRLGWRAPAAAARGALGAGRRSGDGFAPAVGGQFPGVAGGVVQVEPVGLEAADRGELGMSVTAGDAVRGIRVLATENKQASP